MPDLQFQLPKLNQPRPLFARTAAARLQRLARGVPVVVLTGPRQSGKTTLARSTFPGHGYVSLEEPDVRLRFSGADAAVVHRRCDRVRCALARRAAAARRL